MSLAIACFIYSNRVQCVQLTWYVSKDRLIIEMKKKKKKHFPGETIEKNNWKKISFLERYLTESSDSLVEFNESKVFHQVSRIRNRC